MTIDQLLNDKSLKPKAKTAALSEWLIDGKIKITDIINYAQTAKDSPKATCIEVLEFATRQQPAMANKKCLDFVTVMLKEKAPRVKWESAKVIGNIAHLFPDKLDQAISNLLANTESEGTVVRWAAAFALGEIIKLNTKMNPELIPAIKVIADNETDNAIKKKYLEALKKVKQ